MLHPLVSREQLCAGLPQVVGTSEYQHPRWPCTAQEWSCRDGRHYSAFSKVLQWGRRGIGLYGYFLLKRTGGEAWCRASAVTGCCTYCIAPLARASRSACRSWTPWGPHLYLCGVLTKHSKAGMVTVLKDKLIRVHKTLHFREHSQLDTGWFLHARVVMSPSQGLSAATYGFSRAAEHST